MKQKTEECTGEIQYFPRYPILTTRCILLYVDNPGIQILTTRRLLAISWLYVDGPDIQIPTTR